MSVALQNPLVKAVSVDSNAMTPSLIFVRGWHSRTTGGHKRQSSELWVSTLKLLHEPRCVLTTTTVAMRHTGHDHAPTIDLRWDISSFPTLVQG